jgi:hypothetical protein
MNEFLSNVKDEVLDPLKEMHKDLKIKGTKFNEDYRRSEKILQETLDKLERVGINKIRLKIGIMLIPSKKMNRKQD